MTTSPAAADPTEPTGLLVTALRGRGGTRAVCDSLMALLTAVDGVALTVFTADSRVVVAAAGIGADLAEDLQISLDEGPCLDAYHTGQPVLADDLTQAAARQRWPRYAARAVTAGLPAAFAFPVLLDAEAIAVFNLFRITPGPLAAGDHANAVRYAQATAVLLSDDVTDGEPEAGARLDPSIARMQQATGMVMIQADVAAEAALHLIRQYAFDHARHPADVVTDVLARHIRFDPTPTS